MQKFGNEDQKFCAKCNLITIYSLTHRHSYLILDPRSEVCDHFQGGEAPSEIIVESRSRIQNEVVVTEGAAVDCNF